MVEWHYHSGIIFTDPRLAMATCFSYSFPAVHGGSKRKAITTFTDIVVVKDMKFLHSYRPHDWHTPWGWATWRGAWNAIGGANWTGYATDLGPVLKSRGMYENLPTVARCNNIGSTGVNMRTDSGVVHLRLITSNDFSSRDLAVSSIYHPVTKSDVGALRSGIELKYYPLNKTIPEVLSLIRRGSIKYTNVSG